MKDPNGSGAPVILFKVRGATAKPGMKENPNHAILRAILEGRDQVEIEMTYEFHQLLKLRQWKICLKSDRFSDSNPLPKPGELLEEIRVFRLNNLNMPIYTLKEYIRRRNRALRNKDLPLFEKYLPKGISYMFQRMEGDDLLKG